MLEKEIEKNILIFLEEIGIKAWKNPTVGVWDQKRKAFRRPSNRFQIRGVADILGILPDGRFLAIEVKSKKGVTRPEQKKFLEDVASRSGLAMIARGVVQVHEAIKRVYPDFEKHNNLAEKWAKIEKIHNK